MKPPTKCEWDQLAAYVFAWTGCGCSECRYVRDMMVRDVRERSRTLNGIMRGRLARIRREAADESDQA